MNCYWPGSSVHEILQARILEWVAILFSRGCSWPRDRTWISEIAGNFFTIWAAREAHLYNRLKKKFIQTFLQMTKLSLMIFIICLWQNYIVFVCVCVLVAQLCLTLCNPMGCSPPGSSVHGVLQARILENSRDREAWWATVHGVTYVSKRIPFQLDSYLWPKN